MKHNLTLAQKEKLKRIDEIEGMHPPNVVLMRKIEPRVKSHISCSLGVISSWDLWDALWVLPTKMTEGRRVMARKASALPSRLIVAMKQGLGAKPKHLFQDVGGCGSVVKDLMKEK